MLSSIVGTVKGSINQHFEGAAPHRIVAETAISVTSLFGLIYAIQNREELKEQTIKLVFGSLKNLPGVQGLIDKEADALKEKIKHELRVDGPAYTTIPEQAVDHQEILNMMRTLRDNEQHRWKDGKVSGVVYSGDEQLTELMSQAYSFFSLTNPLHPDVFPSIRKFESEIIRMAANMMNGDANVCGALTSGGTESILMAVKAYRDFYNKKNPEMIVPVTAHAAFDKAAHYFGIKLVHVPVDQNMFADISAVKKAINRNTILIVGSAPQYAHGTVDPIPQLAAIAKERGIGFHTDACLGGFVLPWLKRQGLANDIPDFDFSVEGVTSMSADTHKYGFATKGTSVVLFRNEQLRHAMFFVAPNWPGGMYASPTIAGSRPGGLIACCWAALVGTGQSEYKRKSKEMFETAMLIKEGIKKIPGVFLVGDSYSTVIAFGSKINVFKIADAMKSKGWALNNLQRPPAVHICVTYRHVGKAQDFLNDLTDSVRIIKDNPDAFPNGTAGVYGMAASFPDRATVAEIGIAYLDGVLSTF